MNPLKIVVLAALAIVIFKFVASLFGKGDIPILNRTVTVILAVFVTFELVKLGQILWEKFYLKRVFFWWALPTIP